LYFIGYAISILRKQTKRSLIILLITILIPNIMLFSSWLYFNWYKFQGIERVYKNNDYGLYLELHRNNGKLDGIQKQWGRWLGSRTLPKPIECEKEYKNGIVTKVIIDNHNCAF